MTPPDAGPDAYPASIDCETAVRRLWDFLDGRLTDIARTEVEEHLATCVLCPPHFDFARTMRGALAASAPPDVPDDDEARLRERVRSALRSLRTDDITPH
ncbi:MAG TPA: zf-HC2 domain-containing protein [Gemmatimonadaceae bacterium]|nr:zf-HC2 domain-containing protein [Gemmatimonadaceae bacterium]